MILYRAFIAGLISRGAISTVSFVIGFTALIQAQDVIIHVPVSQPGLLEVDAGRDRIAEDPGSILLGEDTEVAGGTPDYIYFWTDPDSQVHKAETLTGTSFGKYVLTVTDQQNCTATDSVSIWNATAVGREKASGHLTFFPNPTKGTVSFNGSGFGGTILAEVIDVSGKVIHRHQVFELGNSGTRTLQLGHLPKGTYLVRLSAGNVNRIGQIQIN